MSFKQIDVQMSFIRLARNSCWIWSPLALWLRNTQTSRRFSFVLHVEKKVQGEHNPVTFNYFYYLLLFFSSSFLSHIRICSCTEGEILLNFVRSNNTKPIYFHMIMSMALEDISFFHFFFENSIFFSFRCINSLLYMFLHNIYFHFVTQLKSSSPTLEQVKTIWTNTDVFICHSFTPAFSSQPNMKLQ